MVGRRYIHQKKKSVNWILSFRKKYWKKSSFGAVLRIRDILVRIRIRTYLWLIDPDPNPAIFVSDLQDANKKLFCFLSFFLLINFRMYTYIIFQRWEVIKNSLNIRNQGFSSFFCLLMEGFGSEQINYLSWSRRHKNILILWIRIRLQNTVIKPGIHPHQKRRF